MGTMMIFLYIISNSVFQHLPKFKHNPEKIVINYGMKAKFKVHPEKVLSNPR